MRDISYFTSKPPIGSICYLDVEPKMGVLVRVIGHPKMNMSVVEIEPVAGDNTSTWVQFEKLYTRVE